MKLYNTYSQKIENMDEKVVNIYNCGPTVYNHIHIGNARPLIVFDVLHRYLVSKGIKVNFLHNLTDIDDKIINEAIKQNKPELEISSFFANKYDEIRRKLNIRNDLIIEKVSDNMDGIIQYINDMVSKEVAYVVDQSVYFDTSKAKDYGKLSNKKIDELINGERVEKNHDKKNESDFVLWKKTNIGIQWDSPWGLGRPGWHSECSYLIKKHFKNNLTIHGGGVDLKFPHHENENAQHSCLYGCGLSKIWMHVGHINVDKQKMSKSLNNFILVKDILEHYSYQAIRWFMYKSNYQNPLEYNQENIDLANNEIAKIKLSINSTKTVLIMNDKLNIKTIYNDEFINRLDNNLNITNATTILHQLIKELNILVRSKKFDESNIKLNEILTSLDILGIEFENIHTNENINMIKKYHQALNEKKYDESDKLRNELINKGLL